MTKIEEVCQGVGDDFFSSMGEVLHAAQGFLDSFELVFDADWEYTLAILQGEGNFYIAPGRTFLDPGVRDLSSNWWNRGTLLDRYQRLRAARAQCASPRWEARRL